jgi:hypothetical protein
MLTRERNIIIISTLDGTAGQDAGGGASTNVLFQAALGVI